MNYIFNEQVQLCILHITGIAYRVNKLIDHPVSISTNHVEKPEYHTMTQD